MAERRMFTKKVTDDDNFMSLSSSAQALYLHLSMCADDDGFCNQVSISMFKAHASVQDLQALLEKRYIYQFDNGVIVIKHWRMANALRKDRYTPTAFQEELSKLDLKDNGSYTWLPSGCQVVADCLPQDSIGKDSIGKDSIGKDSIDKNNKERVKRETAKRFAPPSVDEVRAYCKERNNGIDADTFVDFYTSKGWKVGNNPMKDWKAAVRTWEKRHGVTVASTPQKKVDDIMVYSIDEADENPPYYGLPKEWFDNEVLVRERITRIKQPAIKSRGLYEDVIYSEKEVYEKYLLRKEWFDERGGDV